MPGRRRYGMGHHDEVTAGVAIVTIKHTDVMQGLRTP